MSSWRPYGFSLGSASCLPVPACRFPSEVESLGRRSVPSREPIGRGLRILAGQRQPLATVYWGRRQSDQALRRGESTIHRPNGSRTADFGQKVPLRNTTVARVPLYGCPPTAWSPTVSTSHAQARAKCSSARKSILTKPRAAQNGRFADVPTATKQRLSLSLLCCWWIAGRSGPMPKQIVFCSQRYSD
jgi:hypothetical protein